MTNKLTLIKRTEPICPNCIKMQEALDTEGIQYNLIDIAVEPEAVDIYGIMSVPVILINDGGSDIRLNGLQSIEMIKELLED